MNPNDKTSSPPKIGTKFACYFPDDDCWYKGTVTDQLDDNRLLVKHEDGWEGEMNTRKDRWQTSLLEPNQHEKEKEASIAALAPGSRIRVYWPDPKRYHAGTLAKKDADSEEGSHEGPHYIEYDDGQKVWTDLMKRKFEKIPDKASPAHAGSRVTANHSDKAKARNVRCDICGFLDGHKKLVLISCDKCELHVHRECYGMQTYTLKTFTCWVCQAVGKSFEIEERNDQGYRRRILQQNRPTKCALCSVSGGNHAMHPLYDRAGPGGRQIYVDEGLAWVHTLCAFSLSVRSLLFGCSRDGFYGGDNYDSEDERSRNPELMDDTQEGDEFGTQFAPIHHFVYDCSQWTKNHYRLSAEMKQLRCSICGADDKPEDVLRVCLQCNANDDCEYVGFKGKHYEDCTEGVHVGCARWGGSNANGVQRVYYFPGDNREEPVVNFFCSLHAKNVDEDYQNKLQGGRRQTVQSHPRREQPRRQPSQPPAPRNNSRELRDKIFNDLKKKKIAKITDVKRRQEVLDHRKQHWKSKLSMLTKDEFTKVWKTAREDIRDYIIGLQSTDPTQGANLRGTSVQPVGGKRRANRRREKRIYKDQEQIKNQMCRPRTENGSAMRATSANDVVSKPTGKRRGSKRKRKVQVNVDDDSENEFE